MRKTVVAHGLLLRLDQDATAPRAITAWRPVDVIFALDGCFLHAATGSFRRLAPQGRPYRLESSHMPVRASALAALVVAAALLSPHRASSTEAPIPVVA